MNILFNIAEKIWPELKTLTGHRRLVGVGEVITFLYSTPLALIGIVWLVFETDLNVFRQHWAMLILLLFLMFVFRRLGFFMIAETRPGRYASADGSMESMILFTALFLYGPTALWLTVFWLTFDIVTGWHDKIPAIDRWNRVRNYTLYLISLVLSSLIALRFYALWGGEIPLRDISLHGIILGLGAIAIHFLLVFVTWSGYIAYAAWVQKSVAGEEFVLPLLRFLFIALGLPNLAHPFAILAASLYELHGLWTLLFFITGLILVALLTRQLSWAAENQRQQSRQLLKLEQLSRDLLNAPPDASILPIVLKEHVPSMFPSGRIAIWISPDQLLLTHPVDWSTDLETLARFLSSNKGTISYLAKELPPWFNKEGNETRNPIILAPILDVEKNEPIGGIYLELYSLAQPWDKRSLNNLFPGVQSLAAQVASALHQSETYRQALAYQKVSQELSLAGKIQSSFLPDELPIFSGWQLAVTLLPARETSGDFFDFIQLSDGKLGLLVADVTDKGIGAALYMALSRTLIRTYAIEFDDEPHPDVVFFAANGRILQDARANLFITAFYGILDTKTGLMTYANAGHNPPYLLRSQEDHPIEGLKQTGMPLGIEEDSLWESATVQINPGDVLVLYTDGIPDSQNRKGEFFEDKTLLEVIHASQGLSADQIQEKILGGIQDFVGDAPQFDDITLMVLVRDA